MYIHAIMENAIGNSDLISVRDRLAGQADTIESTLKPLQEELTRIRTQISFIERALAVGGPSDIESAPSHPADKSSVADRVAEVLSDAGSALHITDIRTRYVAKGYTVPGQGNESNLLVYIVRDPRFVRIAKGTYNLAAVEDLRKEPPQRTVAKRRRRKKAKR